MFFALFLIWMLLPIFTFGHGTGLSYEEIIDGYRVDVGYSPEIVTLDSGARFDFTITDVQTGEEVEYSDVWLRINKETRTLFATGIHKPEFGTTGVLYTFSEPGKHLISARFQSNGETLAEVSFPLTVENTSSSPPPFGIFFAIFGLILGAFLGFLFGRKG